MIISNKLFKLTFLFSLLCFLTTPLRAQDKIKQLDKYVEQAIKDWNIPGVGIAIVKDGKVLLSKGYGLSNVESGKKADENTLFAIASNTKAYTVAAMAQLIEAGKMSWDDKVMDHLPYFKMYDPYVTAEMTLEDLVCHRSGLATFSGDLLWYGTSHSREEVIRRAQYLKPVSDFRTEYGYQNIMFLTAGEVVAKVSGMSWDQYIQKHFLDPLKMNRTVLSVKKLSTLKNVSAPHNVFDGKNVSIDWVDWDNIGPAGSIISSPKDYSNWLLMLLNHGVLGTDTFFTQASQNNMWTIHTPKNLSNFHRENFPSKHFAGYGLGWDLFDYQGRLIVNHGGGYDGFISHSVLVPEENLGFVIFTNNISSFAYAMVYQFLDVLLDAPEPKDWGAKFLAFEKQDAEWKLENEKKLEAERHLNTTSSLMLQAYTGTYTCKMYGDCEVTIKNGDLYFDMLPTALYHGSLTHWHYDTFRLHWDEQMMLPKGFVTFVLDQKGNVSQMKIDCPNPDLDFTELEFFRK